MADSKSSAKEATLVKYIAIKPCVYKGAWLDRNAVIEIPSSVKMNHAALKPYDTALVAKRMEDIDGDELFDPIRDALGKRRIDEATRGLKPNL